MVSYIANGGGFPLNELCDYYALGLSCILGTGMNTSVSILEIGTASIVIFLVLSLIAFF